MRTIIHPNVIYRWLVKRYALLTARVFALLKHFVDADHSLNAEDVCVIHYVCNQGIHTETTCAIIDLYLLFSG